jgi:glycosyltransferase involved in cell wall biosynthesis
MTISEHRSGGVPRVSIGMPVWNGQAFIREGLESLLGQSFGDFELIVSDNASSDDTQAIVEEYTRRDPRVRYDRNPVNVGLQGNFARVLELASAPYFMWACHDDQWDPSYVARMVDVLDREESVVLAGSNAASIDQKGVPRAFFDNVAVYSVNGTAARARRFIRARPGDGHATLVYGLMRTPVIKQLGYAGPGPIRDLEKGYYFAIDSLTVFRLLFKGAFHVEPETLYSRRDIVRPRTDDQSRGVIGRLALERVPRVARKVRDVHRYYRDLRTILRGSDLDSRQKAALSRATFVEELHFYPSFARTLLARRIPRA